MTKWTKRDLEGWEKMQIVFAEAKEYAELMDTEKTEVVNGIAITKGKQPKPSELWDMDKITAKYPTITKAKFSKLSNTKPKVTVKAVTK